MGRHILVTQQRGSVSVYEAAQTCRLALEVPQAGLAPLVARYGR